MSAVWIVTVRGDDSSDYSVDSVHETKASADACALHFSGFSTRVEEWKVRREIEETAPTCAQCGTSWEEETGANEFGCWCCGGTRSVNVSTSKALQIMRAYSCEEQRRRIVNEICQSRRMAAKVG